MKGHFEGVFTALITPFNQSGVNFDELGRLIDFQIVGGVDGLVILGTTGEPSTMTDEEKTEVIKYCVKKADKRVKIIIGTGSNDTAKAVASSINAEKLGANGVLAVTPYYNKCTQRGIYGYYKAICDAVKIPVIAYNVPSRTGVNITPETAEKLADLPNMEAIKEASGIMAQTMETMRRIRGKMNLFSGEDALNLPIMAIGGAGVISVASNVAPKLVTKMVKLARDNKFDEAMRIQDLILPLENALFCEVNPIPVKAAMNMLGFDVGTPRAPLTELEDEHKKLLQAEMKKVGLI